MPLRGDQCREAGDLLFYDGGCPLCAREINKLKGLDRGGLNCIDVSQDYQPQLHPSINVPDKKALLRRLHLRKADGTWLVGLRANIYAWRNTSYAKLWDLLSLPVIFPEANWLYESWARLRQRDKEAKP